FGELEGLGRVAKYFFACLFKSLLLRQPLQKKERPLMDALLYKLPVKKILPSFCGSPLAVSS
ncbi:MAG: hypothetical protein KDD06_04895, partial [Phaeodactylibacter sp.]|nr:hypothetical protein [Phaeodactylibacter sp.]